MPTCTALPRAGGHVAEAAGRELLFLDEVRADAVIQPTVSDIRLVHLRVVGMCNRL